MKNITTGLLALMCFITGAAVAQSTGTPAKVSAADTIAEIYVDSASLVLSVPYGVSKGYNGAGVAYNPVKKLYYAGFAGNTGFPMLVFNAKGEVVTDTCTTMIDIRGLWYNSKTATLEANGYAQQGMIQYKLSKTGVPVSFTYLFSDSPQPEDNSVAAFDPVHNELLYFEDDYPEVNVVRYNKTTGKKTGTINLSSEDESVVDYLNPTVVYTGIKGAELALLDYDLAVIHLFDIADGTETKRVYLPVDAVAKDMFNFAYANGMFWLFDPDSRVWDGYKVK